MAASSNRKTDAGTRRAWPWFVATVVALGLSVLAVEAQDSATNAPAQDSYRFELEPIRPGLTAVSIFRGGYADWVLFVRFGDETTESTLALEDVEGRRARLVHGESEVELLPDLQRIRIAGLPVSRHEGAVILVAGWPQQERPRVRSIGRINPAAERAPTPAAELYEASVDLRGKIQYMMR